MVEIAFNKLSMISLCQLIYYIHSKHVIVTVQLPEESVKPVKPNINRIDNVTVEEVKVSKVENSIKSSADTTPRQEEHSSDINENMENDTKYLTGENPICNIMDTRIQIAGNRSFLGNLVLTNYRLQFVVSKKILISINSPSLYSYLNIPLGSIDKLEKEKKSKEQKLYEQKLFNLHNSNNSSVNIASNVTVNIHCKDMRIIRLTLPYTSNINSRISNNNVVYGGNFNTNIYTEGDIENFLQTIADVAFPYDRRGLFAFSHKMTTNNNRNYDNNFYNDNNDSDNFDISNSNNNCNNDNNDSNNIKSSSIGINNERNDLNSNSDNSGDFGNIKIDTTVLDNHDNDNNNNNKNNNNNDSNNRTVTANPSSIQENTHTGYDRIYRKPTAIFLLPLPPFDLRKEFLRLGVLDILAVTEKSERASLFRLSDVNINYNLCNTYPKIIIVPSKMSDEELLMSANFRSGHRLPALCWADKETGVCVYVYV